VNRSKVVSYLNQISKSADGFTALHYASFFGNLKLMRLLVENGADVAVVNDQAINALHCAA
jgi:ankyrin repeat protein